MEYWLKCGEDSIQLPIRPSAFQITQENSHQMVNVQTRGDVTILGKKGLKTYTFESFFLHRTIRLRTMQKIGIPGNM